MAGAEGISKRSWETLVFAPLHVYSHVASADGPPTEAQFRRLMEELESAREAFGAETVGGQLVAALVSNIDPCLDPFRES